MTVSNYSNSEILSHRADNNLMNSFPLSDTRDLILYDNRGVKLISAGSLPANLVSRIDESLTFETNSSQRSNLAIDLDSGYVGFVQSDQCYVYKINSSAAPFVLSLPKDNLVNTTTPRISFIHPSQISKKSPGLVVCFDTGFIQYWSNIHNASNTPSYNNSQGLQLPLEQTETVLFLTNYQSSGLLVGTSRQVFYVDLKNEQPNLHCLTRTSSLLSQFTSFLRRTSSELEGLIAVSYSSEPQNVIYALVSSHILSWHLDEQSPKFIAEWDISSLTSLALNSFSSLHSCIPISILSTQTGRLAILVKITENITEVRQLGLLLIDLPRPSYNLNGRFIPLSVSIDHIIDNDIKMMFSPNTSNSTSQGAIVIQLSQSLAVISLESGHSQVIIPMKSDKVYRLLEVHCINTDLALMACLAAGFFQIQFSWFDSQSNFSNFDDHVTLNAQSLKSLFIQAIEQENSGHNPVSFCDLLRQFPHSHDLQDVLITELVDDIISLNFPGFSFSLDLQRQLRDRHLKLKSLASILNDSELISHLTIDVRFHIVSAAQKITAATALYLHLTHRLQENELSPASQLLNASIKALYHRSSIQSDESQHFFNHDVQRVSELLRIVSNQSEQKTDSTSNSSVSRSLLIFESNLILLKTLQTVLNFTNKYSSTYNIEASPSYEPWMDDVHLLDTVQACFQRTFQVVSSQNHSSDLSADDAWVRSTELQEVSSHPRLLAMALKRQVGGLGENLLRIAHSQVKWARERQSSLLSQRVKNLEKISDAVYSVLSTIHLSKEALALAERHQDFRSLSKLLISSHDHFFEAKRFGELYGSAFIHALLECYIQNNSHHHVLEWSEYWPDQVANFLSDSKYDNFSWLFDLGKKAYEKVNKKLSLQLSRQSKIIHRKTLLSLNKLAKFASSEPLMPELTTSHSHNSYVEEIDDQLDVLSVHEQIQQFLVTLVSPGQPTTAEFLVKSFLPEGMRSVRPIQTRLVCDSVQSLLNGQMLPFECLIDLLTLKGNSVSEFEESASNGFELALEVIRRNDSRASSVEIEYALSTVWRRVLLFDCWDQIDRDGKDLGDQVLFSRLQETALYGIILTVLDNNLPIDIMLTPRKCMFNTSSDHLSDRFPTLTALEIHQLNQDFARENSQLDYFCTHHKLDDYYRETYDRACSDLAHLHEDSQR